LLACYFCLLHSCEVGTLLAAAFPGQSTVLWLARVNALHQALQTTSAAMVTPKYAYGGVPGLLGCTASQTALLLHTDCSAEQAPVLYTDL